MSNCAGRSDHHRWFSARICVVVYSGDVVVLVIAACGDRCCDADDVCIPVLVVCRACALLYWLLF